MNRTRFLIALFAFSLLPLIAADSKPVTYVAETPSSLVNDAVT